MNIDKINKAIIKYRLIRRAIVFILLPIVIAGNIDSYLLYRAGLLEYTVGLIGFLGIVNGLVATILGFYFTGRADQVDAD